MDKLTGSLSSESTMRGTLMITARNMPIPVYTGTYNVTPTQSQQTLETNGKKMVEDVIVEPIPSQYIIPSGTLEVTENGQQSVREYENVNVNVPTPAGEKTINVTQNGTMTEDVADYATAKVVTNVPASEVDTGTKNISENGTHNVVGYASANVNVPASAVDSGTKNITANGNGQDVVGYAAVNVNVPNSYAAADEGKVVQSGALVSQSSQNITENGTYDTTLKNEVVVDVSGGGSGGMVIASGTWTGDNTATIRVNVGKRMPKTNFVFAVWLDDDTVIDGSDSALRKPVGCLYVCDGHFADFNISPTIYAGQTQRSLVYYDVENGGSTVTKNPAGTCSLQFGVRSQTLNYAETLLSTDAQYVSSLSISHPYGIDYFSLLIKKASGTNYPYIAGATYNWELIYFGSDPTNDIVEVV